MTIFFGVLIWKKAPAAIGAMLDKQIAEIAQQLNEAEQLRLDAESLKAEYEAKLADAAKEADDRSEEHTSELQSLMRISYAVFCLKKKTTHDTPPTYTQTTNTATHHS